MKLLKWTSVVHDVVLVGGSTRIPKVLQLLQDPYWTPPLGRKPGDSPTQDPVGVKDLKQFKEEMATCGEVGRLL